jgi:hypothetical protein
MHLHKSASVCLVAALVVATVEAFAFVALSLMEHRLMTWAQVHTAQRQAAATAGDVDPAMDLNDVPIPAYISNGVVHPYLGFVLRRDFNAVTRLERGGPDCLEYGLNLCEPGLFHDPAPHQVVVAITGGSVAHGFAIRADDLLRDELRRLRPELERVVVLNLALAGYKQPQQLMSLAWVLALGAHVDAVVNIDGFNEVTLGPLENVPKGVFPFYPRGWSLLVSSFDPELQLQAGEIRVLRRTRAERAAAFGSAPWHYSLTAGLVWALLDRPLARTLGELEASLVTDPGTADPGYRVTGPRKTYRNAQEMFVDLAAVWKRCSEQMAYLSTGNGAVYLHFLQPNQYVPDSKRFTAEERATAVAETYPYAQLVRAVYPMLQAQGLELQKHGVRFFDLTGLFEHETQTIYIDQCCHFNARGNELLVHEVARELASALP